MPLTRIHITGSSGTGKSTLSQAWAKEAGLDYIELDQLYWKPGWVESERAEFEERLEERLQGERWVVDGSYSWCWPRIWSRAEAVLWLDPPLALAFPRLVRRTARRAFLGEELWGGCRETVRKSFFSHESILLWQLTHWQGRKRKMRAAMAEHPRLVHRFGSSAEALDFLRRS